jgi:hypothetical protein
MALLSRSQASTNRAIMLSQNHFPQPQLHIEHLDFLHPILLLQDHILSIGGDVLRGYI